MKKTVEKAYKLKWEYLFAYDKAKTGSNKEKELKRKVNFLCEYVARMEKMYSYYPLLII